MLLPATILITRWPGRSMSMRTKKQGAAIAFAGSTILLALGDGRVLNYARRELELRGSIEPESHSQPRFACASADGHWFAVVFHNGRLHLCWTRSNGGPGSLQLADVRGQGAISAALFTSDNSILVVDRVNRVSRIRAGVLRSHEASFAPALTMIEMAYYYGIVPIYTVFPKPSELDNTIQYVLKKEETTDLGMQQGRSAGDATTRSRPGHPSAAA